MATKKNEYGILKNGQPYEGLHFDTCLGYSCAREVVRELKKKYPNDKWDSKNLGNDYR